MSRLESAEAENREKARVDGGDTVDVGIELDTGPREVTVSTGAPL